MTASPLPHSLLMERLRKAGIPVQPLTSCEDFYHEGVTLPEVVRDIRSDASFLIDKPSGGLWLSRGVKTSEGRVKTAWRTFCEGWSEEARLHTFRPVFAPAAFYITLTEENWVQLPVVFNPEARPYTPADALVRNLLDLALSPETQREQVPWLRLLQAGVAAVRVDGGVEGKHFYGYDVDSLVLLQGAAVTAWEEVPS